MKTNSRRRVLISSVAMLLVALVALSTATFAWFTTSTNPYADKFSAKTTKQSTLLLANDSRAGWTSHLEYEVEDKTMYPASGNGAAWVKGTSADSVNGTIDTTTLANVLPTTDDGVVVADYVFVNELNLMNNGTADIKDVVITFYMNTGDNTNAAEYARVALVPFDAENVEADDLVEFADGTVYAKNNRSYNPIIKKDGTKGDAITPETTFTVNVTTDDEVMAPNEVRYYKLYVWFEGQDTACVDANSGQKIPGLRFDISSTVVSE